MKTMRGFTLIELMLVIGILGILAAWGVPSFNQMIASNRLTTNANNLVYAFNLARNEAITQSKPVDVIASANGWSSGWRIEVNGTTLQRWDVLSGNVAISEASNATSFTYNAQGRLTASGSLTLCDTPNSANGRQVDINLVGRASVTTITCPSS